MKDSVPYIVEQGEDLTILALRFGFDADAVWQSTENKHLRDTRPNPAILAPGDVIYIPKTVRNWFPVSAGATSKFSAVIPSSTIKFTFCQNGEPLANLPCTIAELPALTDLKTDANGTLTFRCPYNLFSATVTFPDAEEEYVIRLGHLDPVTTANGIAQRLRHLGYLSSVASVSGSVSDGLSLFQAAQGLLVTGKPDAGTLQKLESCHGS